MPHIHWHHGQGRQSSGWRFDVWLRCMVLLTSMIPATTSLWAVDLAQPSISEIDPRVILARAQAWQARGVPFPDADLRQAVEAALQPEAPWDQITAAITAFDVYHDRPWVTQVLQPFVVYHAAHILLNADVFARLHRAWTTRAIEVAAPQVPGLVLGTLRTLVTIDAAWAKQLATTVVTAAPALVWPHINGLLAIDVHWAEGLLRQAATVSPYDAIRAVSAYRTAPWGPQFFADVVLSEPRGVVSLLMSDPGQHPVVRRALAEATHPAVQILVQLIHSSYPTEIKGRIAVFVEDIAAHALSVETAAQLSGDARTYFRALVGRQLQAPEGRQRAMARALMKEVSLLVEEMNRLFEHPAAVRFRAVEAMTAQELYLVLTYGAAEMFTSTYRGVFARLLTRMHQEGLTGDQLLAVVHHLRFRGFITSAAALNRLAMFLATIPSPVARWTLLTRCLTNLDSASDGLAQAVTAAELVSAPLDPASLRLLRDTLHSEYTRAEVEHNDHARLLYGLLLATLAQRHPVAMTDAALTAIAARYLPFLPDLTRIPVATLFHQGVSIHRYFFYNDDDGQQSFRSFLAQYRADRSWYIEEHGTFVHIRAHAPGRTIEIYANTVTEDDHRSHDIDAVLRARRVIPSVIVHRGHSIYVARTLEKLPATAALVYLGNCGGTTLLDTVLNKAPAAQIMTTKGIGSHTINDPLLKAFNDYLRSAHDMTWASFWRQAAAALGRNPRFVDYVPPDKNAGAAFLIAYRRIMTAQPAAFTGSAASRGAGACFRVVTG